MLNRKQKASPSGLLVMVVEDEKLLLEAIQKKMASKGMGVIACESAEQALGYLRSQAKRLPDVIWLDYKLTGISGLEFMKQLKQNDEWASIPVVVVSNSINTAKINNMMELGVKGYYQKATHKLEKLIDLVADPSRQE